MTNMINEDGDPVNTSDVLSPSIAKDMLQNVLQTTKQSIDFKTQEGSVIIENDDPIFMRPDSFLGGAGFTINTSGISEAFNMIPSLLQENTEQCAVEIKSPDLDATADIDFFKTRRNGFRGGIPPESIYYLNSFQKERPSPRKVSLHKLAKRKKQADQKQARKITRTKG